MFVRLQNLFLLLVFLLGPVSGLKGQDELFRELNYANSLIYSNPSKAIELSEKIYQSSGDNQNLKLNALLVSGMAYSEKLDIEKSIGALQKALEIAKSEKDFANQIRALSLLGYQYQVMQIHDQTHTYLDEAERVMSQFGLPDSLAYLRGNNYSIKALTYRQTLDCGYAIDYFNKAISVYKKLDNSDVSQTNLSIAYLNKALCFLENNNPDSAKSTLSQGDRILKNLNLKEDDISISQEIAWAKYYLKIRNFRRSVDILLANLDKIERLSQVDIDLEIYELLSKNYLAMNDVEQYNYYSNLYIEAQKKISEAEKQSITHIINKPPQFQKKSAENSNQISNYILWILAVIIALILFFLAKSYRLKKKLKDLKSNRDL